MGFKPTKHDKKITIGTYIVSSLIFGWLSLSGSFESSNKTVTKSNEPQIEEIKQQSVAKQPEQKIAQTTTLKKRNSNNQIPNLYIHGEEYIYVANYGVTDIYGKRKELHKAGLYYAPSSIKQDGNIVTFKQAFTHNCLPNCSPKTAFLRIDQFICNSNQSIPLRRALATINQENKIVPFDQKEPQWTKLWAYEEYGSEHPDATLYSKICGYTLPNRKPISLKN
ncbi:MAG: hypothetical protein KME09_12755 [Pleurocapsa minor HA4230-MV1]|jgi:hypothetical protein|nr:hypothetical protein [Pleurocapsa minor HA4230-MV1]